MKKIAIVVVWLLLLSMLLSCGSGTTETECDPTESEPAESETPKEELPEEPDVYSRLSGVIATDKEGVYAISFANGKQVEFSSAAAEQAYASAVAKGFEGNLLRFLNLAVHDARNKFYIANETGALAFGKAVSTMLENYGEYFYVTDKTEGYEVAVVETEGYVIKTGLAYANSSTQTYRYTQKIKVTPGQIFELICNGEKVAMRYAVPYNHGASVEAECMEDASCRTTSYVIPDGVDEIVATFKDTDGQVFARLTGTIEAKPALQNKVDSEVFAKLASGKNREPGPQIMLKQASLKNGYMSLGENHVLNNKRLTLTFDIDELGEGETISLGHGENVGGGSVAEITKTHIRSYYYMGKQEEYLYVEHGLDLSGTVKVIVRVGFGMANIRIETESGVFVTGDFKWGGRRGDIFAKSVGAEMENVSLGWSCSDFTEEIWMLGDSYFNMTDAARWPVYMLKEGYTEYLLSGYPGRKSKEALDDFKELLEFGTPKYAVWCLGMNDKDNTGSVNASWKTATEEFIAICEEKGIIPILATIPNTPTNLNTFKNEIVKASGYRYIDFASAVNANEAGSPWTEGMLSGDKVHPAQPGAKALWEQVKKDFPEIMK